MMTLTLRVSLFVALFSCGEDSRASDACSTLSIRTAAHVEVSDGTEFDTLTWYQAPDQLAIRHLGDDRQTVAVEGPFGWASNGDAGELGTGFYKQFALGHQYHALLLHFREILGNVRDDVEVEFHGMTRRASVGTNPYGGEISVISDNDRPSAFVFDVPGAPRITVELLDWREAGGLALPFLARIDDTERVFDYRYSEIEVATDSPLWFFHAVGAPDIDQVQVYRLHRSLLAAHCLGDAALMAELSAAETVVANRGELMTVSRSDMLKRFSAAFERFDYQEYIDIRNPVIEISESGDAGWIAANVRARGHDRVSARPFDDQWAWVMMVRKTDGAWLHAGNASSRRQ